jgi:hypothetical protein
MVTMKQITVPLNSLKHLVEKCMDSDARCSAELMAIKNGAFNNRDSAVCFNSYVAQVLAEARLTMQPRYQELLDVIARKPDAVYDALRKFTKSSETSSDQCRPPFQRSSS